MSEQPYTDIKDFMPYAVASVKSFITNGDIDVLQGFVNDLNTLSENIDSFIQEIPGYLERYQQIMDQKRALEEEDARRRAQQAEINKRLRDEFGIGTDTEATMSGETDSPQGASESINVSADDFIGDLGFDFTTPDDGTADNAPQDYVGDGMQNNAAYQTDGTGYAPDQDGTNGYPQNSYGQYDQQQMPDDNQGYPAAYGNDDFMDGYGDGNSQDAQYMNQMPDVSFGQNPAMHDDYADMGAVPMDPSSMSQAPDMYADDDIPMPSNGQQGHGSDTRDGYQQDGAGYGDFSYPAMEQEGFDPFAQGMDGEQQQYQDYGQQQDAYPQQGYDQGGTYPDAGQGYAQDMSGYQDQTHAQPGYDGNGQMPQGYADEYESDTGMAMEDLMAEADQNQPAKKRGRRKRGKGSGLKVTPQQQQPAEQAPTLTDDAARMDALLDDDFDM